MSIDQVIILPMGNFLISFFFLSFFPGHLSEEESRRIFHQLLDAVTYIHSIDIVHRDIKCDNIYFDEDYNIKLGGKNEIRRIFVYTLSWILHCI